MSKGQRSKARRLCAEPLVIPCYSAVGGANHHVRLARRTPCKFLVHTNYVSRLVGPGWSGASCRALWLLVVVDEKSSVGSPSLIRGFWNVRCSW